jgi:hypothetical protein
MNLIVLTLLSLAPDDTRLSFFAGAGSLGAQPGAGAAIETGIRLRALEHLSASFDMGYGVLGSSQTVQDRWWLTPSLAFTFSAGPVQLDLGAGVGLGAASGYSSWRTYFKGPFDPDWAFQLVPMGRLHATAAMQVTGALKLFVRAEAATLILPGTGIGSRVGNAQYSFGDVTWAYLVVGGQLGVW